MNILTTICFRCLLVVVVLAVASTVATLRGPLSLTRLAIILLLVLVLLVPASLGCAPLHCDVTHTIKLPRRGVPPRRRIAAADPAGAAPDRAPLPGGAPHDTVPVNRWSLFLEMAS